MAFILIVSVWEVVVRLSDIKPITLPSPLSVAFALVSVWDQLAWHSVVTALEAIAGFIVGGILAIFMALLFERFPLLRRAFYPHIVIFKSVPLVALAPIVTIWLGSGVSSKVALAAIISFFPIMVSLIDGLRSTPRGSVAQFEALGASKGQVIWKLRLPAAMPDLFAGLKVSSTFSVVGAVVAEFVGAKEGLGYFIKISLSNFRTEQAFSAIILAGAIGVIFFSVVSSCSRRLLKWRGENDGDLQPQLLEGYSSVDERKKDYIRRRAEGLLSHWRQESVRTVKLHGLELLVPTGVFPPDLGEGTKLLARTLDTKAGERVLEIGTGSGILAILAARMGADVIATDISSKAVAVARENAEHNGVSIDVRLGDLWEPMRADETFDMIVFNAPFMENPPSQEKAWEAIFDPGYRSLRAFLTGARMRLKGHGRIYIAFSDIEGLSLFKTLVSQNGYHASIADQITDEVSFYVFELRVLEERGSECSAGSSG